MFKALPSIEKEFDMKKVGQSYPTWVRVVMIIFVMAIFFGAIMADWAHAKGYTHYVIEADVTVLAFVGPIGSLDTTPMKYVTAKRQVVKLLHKKSGPGIWAFHLYRVMVRDDQGNMTMLKEDGYFITKRKLVKPFM